MTQVRININSNIVVPPPANKYIGYRVLHKIEGGNQATPANMPEVTPPQNSIALPMSHSIQKMSFELMTHFNSAITETLWTKVHRYDKAFNNGNGFEKPGDPRANYVTGEDLAYPLPKYDKAQRLCGGQFVRGIEGYSLTQAIANVFSLAKTPRSLIGNFRSAITTNNILQCTAGVHGIDGSKTIPSVSTIVENNWYLFAVSVNSDFTQISDFPQGLGGAVAIPFVFTGTIKFPLAYFDKWESVELPNHLKIYL